jgi:hypothetical protein
MIEIDLEVLWLTEEQQELEAAGVSVDIVLDECITKTHTFYQISFIRTRKENHLCNIGSNGDIFIVKESYESVKQKIKDQIIFKWN